jgi:hypothetical protein
MIPLLALAATSYAPADAELAAPPLTPEPQRAEEMTAVARPLSYSFVEGNFLWTDSDDLDEKVTGVELVGSYEFSKGFFGQIALSHQSNDADLDRFRIGVGYHAPISTNLDAYGILSILRQEVDAAGRDFDDTGVAVEVGARYMASPTLELNGAFLWAELEDTDAGVRLGARHYFDERFSFGGRIEFVDSDVTLGLGLRYVF